MQSKDTRFFRIIAFIIIISIAIICLLPVLLVISGSFTSESSIIKYGYSLIPKEFSINAYKLVFKSAESIGNAYLVTVSVTVIGTLIHLVLAFMTAYALSRKDFQWRNIIAFYILFTLLFSGGLVPWYILCVRYLHLKDTFFALLQFNLVSAWSVFIMRTNIKQISEEIIESALMDGAGEFRILSQLIVPLSAASITTIALLTALTFWNDWSNAMLFINNQKLYPLQYLLYKILNSAEFMHAAIQRGAGISSVVAPRESVKMAVACIATGPIIFLFPFLQRYFVKGLAIGAIKG